MDTGHYAALTNKPGRYPVKKMKIEPLGELRRDPDIEDWFVSKEVPLPYLDGQKLDFAIEGIEADDNPDDFIEAITNLFSLTPVDREEATPYVTKIEVVRLDMEIIELCYLK